MTPIEVVQAFWEAMKTNDFSKAAKWLSDSYKCEWPQSKETIRGRNNFISVNEFYPAEGKWQFDVQEILASNERVVSDVIITDGKLRARAITFSTVKNGLIESQKEFWPDEYEAPKWRAEWVDNN